MLPADCASIWRSMFRQRKHPRLLRAGCVVAAALLLFAPIPSRAQDDGREGQMQSTSRLLEDQKQKIEKEEERLQILRKRQITLQADLTKVEQGLGLVNKAQQNLGQEVQKLEKESTERSLAVDAAKAKLDRLAATLQERLVAMYKTQHRNASLIYVFQATSATDMLKRVTYLGRVAELDKAYIQELTGVVNGLETDRRLLSEVKTKREEKLAQLTRAVEELEGRRLKQASLLRESREQEKQIQRSLDKLQSSARNMEALIASLMGQEGPLIVEELPPEVAEAAEPTPEPLIPEKTPQVRATPEPIKLVKAVIGGGKTVETPSDFDGPGLGALKGKLSFPVQGTVLQHYGKQRHEEFADILFIKGLEIVAASGAEVRAVAPGKVVLNKSLPGYGKVVILDHGKRYYTLYGRLADGKRQVGDIVQAGDVVAALGAPDHRGRNFYFELRIRGKASDPSEFFGRLPKAK